MKSMAFFIVLLIAAPVNGSSENNLTPHQQTMYDKFFTTSSSNFNDLQLKITAFLAQCVNDNATRAHELKISVEEYLKLKNTTSTQKTSEPITIPQKPTSRSSGNWYGGNDDDESLVTIIISPSSSSRTSMAISLGRLSPILEEPDEDNSN